MKKLLLSGCASLLLLGSCVQKTVTTGTNEINVERAFEQLADLKASDLASGIRYVALETTDSSLVGNAPIIKLLNKHILVISDKQCLLFDKQTGKFLRAIGHIGDDPQGYSSPNCEINPQNNLLYFPCQNKFIKYDLDGNYAGEAKFPTIIDPAVDYFFTDSLIIGKYESLMGKAGVDNCRLLYFNEKGEKKDSLPSLLPGNQHALDDIAGISVLKGASGDVYGLMGYNGAILIDYKSGQKANFPIMQLSMWENEGDIHFKELFVDTIYSLKDRTLSPLIAFNTGKWHWPAEERNKVEGNDDRLFISHVMETPKCIFFQCIQGLYKKATLFNGVYDKEKGSVKMNAGKEGFTDDFTQFMPIHPSACSPQGEYASVLEAGKIMEWLEEHPETSKEGKLSFLKEINEDANPVCVILE